jgi:uncharacterized protein YcfJ
MKGTNEMGFTKSLLALSLVTLCGNAFAADFTDSARVISSTPIYERVSEPKRECWTETVQAAPRERSMGGAVMGGVAGGLLGSQVGSGNGRTVATGAGAVAGAVAGDRIANPDSNRSATGAVVGGVAGALLGSQIGGGTGNKVATAAGAIAGAVIGDRVANPDYQARSEQVERCRDVQTSREVIKGYSVTYRYNGQDITTTLPYQPGETVRVGVSLSVLDDGRVRDDRVRDDRADWKERGYYKKRRSGDRWSD